MLYQRFPLVTDPLHPFYWQKTTSSWLYREKCGGCMMVIYPDLCYSCFIYHWISWVIRDSQRLLKSTSLSTSVPRIRICPWLFGISCCWFISEGESPVPCSHPSWLYRPPELTSLCQIQWYNVSCREFLHSPSLLFLLYLFLLSSACQDFHIPAADR